MRKFGGVGIFFSAIVTGCTTVPPLQEDGIAIQAIVQRVKCEIALAIPEPEGPYPTGRFQWMRTWTSKVDLTLKTNGKSAIAPSVVFNRILPDFTLGLNAGIETKADRTEILSFSLSFAEMLKFRRDRDECNLPDGLGLYGNLGLREWVQSALAPVEAGQLTLGYHPSIAKKPTSPLPGAEFIFKLDDLSRLIQATTKLEGYAENAVEYGLSARNNAFAGKYKEIYDDANKLLGIVSKATNEYYEVKRLVPKLLKQYRENNERENNESHEHNNKQGVEKLQKRAQTAFKTIADEQKEVTSAIKDLPLHPPINSISHSVNFAVELKGGASPNWTLVGFRGPTAGGTFASGSYVRTHTLAIAMGPAEAPGELVRQLNNLAVTQNLQTLPPQ